MHYMLGRKAILRRSTLRFALAAIIVGVLTALGFGILHFIHGLTFASSDSVLGSSTVRFGNSTGPVVKVPADIATNCSTDTTDRLNNWLATVPDGATIVFAKGGCYQLDRTLNIANRNNLTLEGNGATLKRKTPTPPELLNYLPPSPLNPRRLHNIHVYILNSKNITVRNITIVGLNTVSDIDATSARGKTVFEPTKFGSVAGGLNPGTTARYKEGEAGISIIGSDNITLTHIKTDGTYGDGIGLGSDNVPVSRRISLNDIEIDRNGRQGIFLGAVENVLIDNARILHSHGGGFDLEPDGLNFVKGVEIRNSYVNSYNVAFGLAGANDVSDINIHDNTVRDTLYSYPWFNGVHGTRYTGVKRVNWRIINNVSVTKSIGIKVYNVSDVTIEGNRQETVDGRPGVESVNVGGVLNIKGNEFTNASTTYTTVRDSAEILACGNKLTTMGSFDQPSVCQ